ncbi:MAG: hypothetical protein CM1200mP12_19900 [Gammaproteobacteria bacterium]|nr:MAG: hypothetical protein CM1200mP12_19900 [Gammaproteobacteria bacterium]
MGFVSFPLAKGSDSDMHTRGFRFKPWIDERFIADGPSIINYLDETISENNLKEKIKYQRKVLTPFLVFF